MRNVKSFLVAGVALAALASPAAAQWYGSYPYNAPPPYGYGGQEYSRALPRDVIVDRLEDRGFDDVGRPRFDGSVYVVEATSRRRGPVRLVVDAFDGRILRETPLSVARLGDDDGMDLDGYYAPSRRGAYPPPEMRNAPRYRDPEPLPGRQAVRPVEPEVVAPAPRDRARPIDPRLAPETPPAAARPAAPDEPRQEASRPAARDLGPSAPGGVEGVNPDSKRAARPAPKPASGDAAARPAKPEPTAKTSPTAPVPSTAARPEEKKPAGPAPATAEAGERKAVRVIEGVTPMNSGQQASPAPQNNVEAKPSPAPN